MHAKGNAIFIQSPLKQRDRVLRAAVVSEVGESTLQVELRDDGPVLQPNADGMIYFDQGGDFMQQQVTVTSIFDRSPGFVVTVQLHNSAVSAESRQSYRASTTFTEKLSAKLGYHDHCSVQDISTSGFSVVGPEGYARGRMLECAVTFEGQTFAGNVCIQSVRSIGRGEARYGLHCIDDFGPLNEGMRDIAMTVQRRHLKNRRQGA